MIEAHAAGLKSIDRSIDFVRKNVERAPRPKQAPVVKGLLLRVGRAMHAVSIEQSNSVKQLAFQHAHTFRLLA